MSNVNIKNITQAARDLLSTHPDVIALVEPGSILIADVVNEDPDLTPWIGIYKGIINYTPRTLGKHSVSWQATVQLRIMLQTVSYADSEDAEEALENLIE